MNRFSRFDLKPFLIDALSKQKIEKPMEIQERLIPAIINGKDVIGQSQTGSGKTLTFLLPVLQKVDPESEKVQAVITAPTRELAGQIYKELEKLTVNVEGQIRTKKLVGGTDRQRTIEKLKQPPHVVVATPGRLKDLVQSDVLLVHETSMLVVDETDQMLDMGFIEDIDQVAGRMPDDLQMMVFSATIPEKLQPFLRKYMTNPRHVEVKPEQATPVEITHYLLPLRHRDRTDLTVQICQSLRPFLALVFTNTKEEADEVFAKINEAGLNVDVLHGGLPPRQRKQVMRRVKDLSVQYLVATDLAARGIDIEGVSHVINHALPFDLEFYIHRAGRSGRAGLTGEVYTIVEKDDQAAVEKLRKKKISFTSLDIRRGTMMTLDKPLFVKRKLNKPKKTVHVPGVKKPKKVKPGYKKKAKWQAQQFEKRQKRLQGKKKRS